MKAAVFAYSRRGVQTGRRILAWLMQQEEPSLRFFAPASYCETGEEDAPDPIPKPSMPFYGEMFAWADALIFIGALGIAVRHIAPSVKSKTTDPAVLCIDELGHFVIPVLSGHIGGANQMALKAAEVLNAQPVITTATDINHRFAVDAWAARQQMTIQSMAIAKDISAAILERDLPLWSDLPIVSSLPSGIYSGKEGPLGISISWKKENPFSKTLHLIPPVIHLGIGCRKGTPKEAVFQAVQTFLETQNWDPRAVKGLYSIDLKANEEGILGFCQEKKLPFITYTAQELKAVQGDFTPSAFVQNITGVENVCERAALREADRLLVRKTVYPGITLAAALEERTISFSI